MERTYLQCNKKNASYESTVKCFLDNLVNISIATTCVTTDTSRLGMLNTEIRRLSRPISLSNNLDVDTGILGERSPRNVF